MHNNLTLPEIKSAALEVLIELDRVCTLLDLDYYLAFGTLLGAVRHKGFIPWDDDIDVCLFRKDMDILVENFNKVCKPEFKLYSYKDEGYLYPFPKIYNLKTSVEEIGLKNIPNLGVWVDLFNLDYVQPEHAEEDKALIKLEHIRWTNFWKQSTFLEKIKLLVLKIVLRDTKFSDFKNSPQKACAQMNELLAKNKESDEVRCPTTIPDIPKIMKREWFKETVLLEFEGHQFKAPKEYKKILEVLYGNYMELPSVAHQKFHRHFRTSRYIAEEER